MSPTTCTSEKMEKVALNNLQLDHLARSHPKLSRVFYGTVPSDRLPRTLPHEGPTAFIVNTAQVRVTPSVYREIVDDTKDSGKIATYPTVRG